MHVLDSGYVNKDAFLTVLDDFLQLSGKTEEIAENREDVAAVYYQLLSSFQKLYITDNPTGGIITSEIEEKLLTCFANIERLYNEASSTEKETSFVKTIWFLSELKTNAKVNSLGENSQEALKKCAGMLLDVLDDIRFIFDIKDGNENNIFPINKVILAVISGTDFLSFRDGITKDDVQIFKLAVRLFNNDERIRIDEIRDKYHLEFIDYLNQTCEAIDTLEFLNYQKNGVMIFHDIEKGTILIRSDRRDYFYCHDDCGHELYEEKDYDNNPIGWFIKFNLDNGDKLIDYSDLLKNEETKIDFLKLLYDNGFYNVFIQKSIILKSDGSIQPVNPYCFQDTAIVKGLINEKNGVAKTRSQVKDFLKEYRISPVKKEVLNCLTFGLCVALLEIENTGVNSLGLDSLQDSSWYQEQVINSWINYASESSLISFLKYWYNQIRLFENRKYLESMQIDVVDILPLFQDLSIVLQKVCPTIYKNEDVFYGRVIEDENDELYIDIDVNETISSKSLSLVEKEGKKIKVSELHDEDQLYKWDTLVDSNVYFLYSLDKQKGHVIDNDVLKTISGIQKSLCNSLSFDVGRNVTETEYNETIKRMDLFEDAFKEVAKAKKLCKEDDLESQYYLRILYNTICSHITVKSKEVYFYIIRSHQIADFKQIDKDISFSRNNPETLYIPKDASSQSSVLSDVYYKQIKTNIERDTNFLYNDIIEKDEHTGLYKVNGQIIRHIVFLTDNFIRGKSTISALCAYLDIESALDFDIDSKRVLESKDTMHHFYCDKQQISVKNIFEVNSHVDITVHSYYGTEEGKERIIEFLHKNNYPSAECTFYESLDNKANQIVEQARSIWDKKMGKLKSPEGRLFIRKYNMPSYTVLPDYMSGDPWLATVLFVRRKELNSRN